MTFDYWFEDQWGRAEVGEVEAEGIDEARAKIAEKHPDDMGADGELNCPDLNIEGEYPWPNAGYFSAEEVAP